MSRAVVSKAIIVVPCYNEARRLDTRRFEEFAARSGEAHFLMVNDGSRDGTLELLERLHAAQPERFSFLHLPANGGKAEAVRRGMLLAFQSRPRYVGFWDADLATPLDDVPSFCRVLDAKPAVDIVVGSRVPLLGRAIERNPLRHLLGRVFAKTASLVLRIKMYDTQCGAKLFRLTPELRAAFAEPFLARWIFDVEIFARLIVARRGTQLPSVAQIIYEHPLDAWRDMPGSKLKRSDFFLAFFEMARIYWAYLRPGHPAPLALTQAPPAETPAEIKRAA